MNILVNWQVLRPTSKSGENAKEEVSVMACFHLNPESLHVIVYAKSINPQEIVRPSSAKNLHGYHLGVPTSRFMCNVIQTKVHSHATI